MARENKGGKREPKVDQRTVKQGCARQGVASQNTSLHDRRRHDITRQEENMTKGKTTTKQKVT